MWLNQNFLLAKELDFKTAFTASFISLRNSQETSIEAGSNGGLRITTPDMDLAGDLVQSICHFLNVSDLEVRNTNYDEVPRVQSFRVLLSLYCTVYSFGYKH
jgi:hypothetical protein